MRTAILTGIIALAGATASAQGPSAAVFVAASNTSTNTTGSIIFIDYFTPNQPAPWSTCPIPGTGPDALRFSGSSATGGHLSNSGWGVLFAGTNTGQTTGNINTYTARGVGRVLDGCYYNLVATYTGNSGQEPRAASIGFNSNYYIAEGSGLYTSGSTAPLVTGNFLAIKGGYNGLTVGQASASPADIQVAAIYSPAASTITGLPGLTNNPNLRDFGGGVNYSFASGFPDAQSMLYTLSSTSATAGTIEKFSNVGGTWVSNGTYTTAFGGYGLFVLGAEYYHTTPGVHLFVTTGDGTTSGNSLIRLFDASGYNAPISINSAANVTLYTTPAGTTLKGVTRGNHAWPLPLEQQSFVARAAGSTVEARWSTGSTHSVSHFVLERSADGRSFTPVARVEAGNAGDYSAIDAHPIRGESLYRLASVAVDGSTSFSATARVVFGSDHGKPSLRIAPNPVVGHSFTLLHDRAAAGAQAIITDIHGRALSQHPVAEGSTSTRIDDLQLSPGVYLSTYINKGVRQTVTLVR